MARHNATVYGVQQRIDFMVGDFMRLAPRLKADVVFLSPPWGGVDYIALRSFTLSNVVLLGGPWPQWGSSSTAIGEALYRAAASISPNIAYFLPRNVDQKQLASLAGDSQQCEVEWQYLNGKVKTVCVYYGALAGGATDGREGIVDATQQPHTWRTASNTAAAAASP